MNNLPSYMRLDEPDEEASEGIEEEEGTKFPASAFGSSSIQPPIQSSVQGTQQTGFQPEPHTTSRLTGMNPSIQPESTSSRANDLSKGKVEDEVEDEVDDMNEDVDVGPVTGNNFGWLDQSHRDVEVRPEPLENTSNWTEQPLEEIENKSEPHEKTVRWLDKTYGSEKPPKSTRAKPPTRAERSPPLANPSMISPSPPGKPRKRPAAKRPMFAPVDLAPRHADEPVDPGFEVTEEHAEWFDRHYGASKMKN